MAADAVVYVTHARLPITALHSTDGTRLPSLQHSFDTHPSADILGARNHVLYVHLPDSNSSSGSSLAAISVSDGTLFWQQPLDTACNMSFLASGDFASGSTRNSLYFGCLDSFYAMATSDGTVRWQHSYKHRFFGIPSVVGGRVFVGSIYAGSDLRLGPDRNVMALNVKDGSEYWAVASFSDLSGVELTVS